MNRNMRKWFGGAFGASGGIMYVFGAIFLSGVRERLFGEGNLWTGMTLAGIFLLAVSAASILIGRAVFGDGGHGKSRTAVAIALALIPAEKLLLFLLRCYIARASDLTGRIAEIFVRNTGFLEAVLAIATLAIGIFFAATRRTSEYGEKSPDGAESQARAGLLGMLGMAGYDICDVIITSYDGVKTAILVFESEEAWNDAVERGIDREIVDACKGTLPDYDFRFEAKA